MEWPFDWVSSDGSDFNTELGVTHPEHGEIPGLSVFYRDGNEVYQTFFTTGRGLELLNGTFGLLDMVPKGREEDKLECPAAWWSVITSIPNERVLRRPEEITQGLPFRSAHLLSSQIPCLHSWPYGAFERCRFADRLWGGPYPDAQEFGRSFSVLGPCGPASQGAYQEKSLALM